MELELTTTAEAAIRLGRLKSLSACRDGRPRTQAMKIIWHDSPQHALLNAGQTVSEQRGVWRLERLLPARETWLPAQPAPIIQEAPGIAELPDLPTPMAPLAAFEGRRTISVHVFAGSPVTITVCRGVLRSVTAEQPVARLYLSGDDDAVRAAALLLASAEAVSVPLASLAAEAITMAMGAAPRPRHLGAPVLPDTELRIADALRHIIGHLTDVILAYAPLAMMPGDTAPEAVHQMRVAVRRARSALSIFRPALPEGSLDTVNVGLKALGARLGPTRDWDVFGDETAQAVSEAVPGDERLERLVAAATRRRRGYQKDLATYLDSAEFRLLGIELAWFTAASFWEPQAAPDALDLPAFAAQVLQHRWKRLVSSGKRIEELDIPSLHNVRLRAKRARYAAEVFATLHHGKPTQRFIRRLSDLQQRLGVLNDGAVATHLLAELGGPSGRHAYAVGLIVGFLASRAARIRPRIILAFEKFRRQPVYWA